MSIRAARYLNESVLAATKLAIGSIYVSADTLVPYVGTGLGSLPKSLLTGLQLSRPSGAQVNLLNITDSGGSSSGVMTGGANEKTYVLNISVNRPVGSAATGDSNDALIKGTYNNYAANDSNFIMRGINTVVNNRAGGTVGQLIGGNISTSNKSGAAAPAYNWGLSVDVQNLGNGAGTELIGIDIALDNEGSSATTEAGLRIRNRDQSNVEVTAPTAILIPATAGNTKGWTYLLDMNGAVTPAVGVAGADIRLSSGALIRTGSADPNASVFGTNGSIYIRTGTSSHNTCIYVNTNGATAWSAVTGA